MVEAVVVVKSMDEDKSDDNVQTQERSTLLEDKAMSTENEVWDEARKIKYRKMKRKLIEYIAKHKEAQKTIDRLNRKIQASEKSNRNKKAKITDHEDAMDISQDEDDETSSNKADPEEGDEEEEDEGEEEEGEEEDQLDEDDDESIHVPVVKKPRTATISSRRKRVSIPRDENGVVQLPFQIASLNVINLGYIDSKRSQFHNARYIFPIGYTVERTYMSTVEPNNQTTYTCTVEDEKDGPLFTLIGADSPDIKLSAKTATGVWALVIKKANEIRQKDSANAISGPEYFGFSHPLVIEMIEELDGVDDCSRYSRKHKNNK